MSHPTHAMSHLTLEEDSSSQEDSNSSPAHSSNQSQQGRAQSAGQTAQELEEPQPAEAGPSNQQMPVPSQRQKAQQARRRKEREEKVKEGEQRRTAHTRVIAPLLRPGAPSSTSSDDMRSQPAPDKPRLQRLLFFRELISVFDNELLPHDFDSDVKAPHVDNAKFVSEVRSTIGLPSEVFIRRKALAGLWDYAENNASFVLHLSKTTPPEARAISIVEKLDRRFSQLLQDFDEYAREGDSTRPLKVQEDAVAEVDGTMRLLIELLDRYSQSNPSRPAVFYYAATMLAVRILKEAWTRNKDIYSPRPRWLTQLALTTKAPSGPLDGRNVFLHFLSNGGAANEFHRNYVLDFLKRADMWPHLSEALISELRAIVKNLEKTKDLPSGKQKIESGTEVWHILRFLDELRDFVNAVTSASGLTAAGSSMAPPPPRSGRASQAASQSGSPPSSGAGASTAAGSPTESGPSSRTEPLRRATRKPSAYLEDSKHKKQKGPYK